MKVEQLGYLIFDITHQTFAAMRSVFADVIGAKVEDQADGSVTVQMDGRPFRVQLRPSDLFRIVAVGWEVKDRQTLDALSERVRAHGLSLQDGRSADLAARAVEALVRFTDLDGFPVELFVDKAFAADPDLSSRFVCGKTDSGNFGMGHLVQIAADRFAAKEFYQNVLGFGFTDRITWDAADLFFLHCNKRHHSLALAGEVFGLRSGQIDHFMIQTPDKARVDEAYERLQALGFAVSQTLGEHTNDKTYSFYMMTPAGFRLEFGYGGITVEDPAQWQPAVYDSPSSWGHELQHAPA